MDISLGQGCWDKGTVLHEVGHAIGKSFLLHLLSIILFSKVFIIYFFHIY